MELKNHFTAEEMKTTLVYLQAIFDVVRLVDPTDTSILTLDANNHLHKKAYTCFRIWDKDCRCSNCTGMNTIFCGCQKSKYEFIKNNIFYVISKPITLELEAETLRIVLEIVSHVDDQLLLEQKENGKSIAELVDETSRKLYQDTLTSAYNRRFLDEFRFWHKGQNLLCSEVALLLLDVRKFKSINDTMGHLTGDQVLVQVAQTLQKNIRQQDSLIRLGGDEFVIILTGCKETEIIPKMVSLQKEVGKICYSEETQSYVGIDCGYAYTENFKAEEPFLKEMLHTADQWMYLEKSGGLHRM